MASLVCFREKVQEFHEQIGCKSPNQGSEIFTGCGPCNNSVATLILYKTYPYLAERAIGSWGVSESLLEVVSTRISREREMPIRNCLIAVIESGPYLAFLFVSPEFVLSLGLERSGRPSFSLDPLSDIVFIQMGWDSRARHT